MLIYLLLLTAAVPFISAQTDDNSAKVKAQVLKRGTDEQKKVKVKMLTGNTLKGYISRAGDDSFDLTDSKGKVSTLAYRDVEAVKRGGLATSTIVVFAGLAAAAVVIAAIVGRYCSNEGGC